MRLHNKIRNPFTTEEPLTNIDIIITKPTTSNSRASLLLLNDQLRWIELLNIAEGLNVNLNADEITGYGHAKGIVMTALRRDFLDKKESEGKLICEYCGSKVRRDINPRSDRGATIDHRIPQAEGYDPFDVSNYAVACYRCNQIKNKMPYNEWCVIYEKLLVTNILELKRAKLIGESLSKITCKINDILSNDNTQIHKFYQIANIAKLSRDFLLGHLTNMDIDPDNMIESKEHIKALTKINIIARHKANPELDTKLSVENEYKDFFQTNKKWPRIFPRNNK